jgi:nucleotide-binding universal stress UspA family protein
LKKILVATDFSARADRAIRQASLLAKAFDASLVLVNVIDDDRPPAILESERSAAFDLLDAIGRTLRENDGLACDVRLMSGSPSDGIVEAAEKAGADVVVVGAHRRRAVGDVFVGTTAERAVRGCRRPVLMANAVPAGVYHRILVAVDLSAGCGDVLGAVRTLGLDRQAEVSVLYVHEGPEADPRIRAYMTVDEVKARLAAQEKEASDRLSAYLAGLECKNVKHILRSRGESTGTTICEVAREIGAGLIAVGTHGRTGLERAIVGSVAERVLRTAECDVLAVGPMNASRTRV